MCGIVSVFNIVQPPEEIREQVLAMAKKIRHRGPDWSGIFQHSKALMAHERLSIVDPSSGVNRCTAQTAWSFLPSMVKSITTSNYGRNSRSMHFRHRATVRYSFLCIKNTVSLSWIC